MRQRDVDEVKLARDVIERFPVRGAGERNSQVCRAVASLVCRGYGVEASRSVMRAWLLHFQGIYRTPLREALSHLDACLKSANSSPLLHPARSGDFHREERRRAQVDAQHESIVREGQILQEGSVPEGYHVVWRDPQGRVLLVPEPVECLGESSPHYKRGAASPAKEAKRPLHRLSRSRGEIAFLLALLAVGRHKLRHPDEVGLLVTDAQLRQTMSDREGVVVDHKQLRRLRRRYVTTATSPASRFEFLVRTKQGDRRPGQAAGEPSHYTPSGLAALLSSPPSGSSASPPTPIDDRPEPMSPQGLQRTDDGSGGTKRVQADQNVQQLLD